jgi:hypothetical protein
MFDRHADHCRADQNAKQTSKRLRDHLEACIDPFDLAEPEKRQRDSRIQASADCLPQGE